jgi:hypothetical protein
MSARVPRHTSVALLIVGAIAVCISGCRRSPDNVAAGVAGDASEVSRTARASLRPADVNLTPPISAALVRELATSVPEVAALAADAARVEEKLFADLRARATGAAAPQARADAASPSWLRWSRAAFESPRADRRVLSAGFGAEAAEDAPLGGPVQDGLGIALGFLATDMSDHAGGSSRGPQTVKASESGISGEMTMEFGTGADGSRSSGMSLDLTIAKDGVSLKIKASLKAEGDPCPDATGKVVAKFSVVMRADVAVGGKQGGAQREYSGSITGQVGDDAYVSGVEVDARAQFSAQRSASHNAYADVSIKGSQSGRWTAGSTPRFHGPVRVTRSGSTITNEDRVSARDNASEQIISLVDEYVYWLQQRWRDGSCVAIVAPVPGSVKPGSSSSFDVSVKQKRDGTVIHAPVELTLQGQASLKPARIASSSATATYVASGEAGSHATLNFKSTSRRGIGTLDADVTVGRAGYDAKGGQNIAISGSVCGGVESPFTLQGRPPDGSSVTFSYSPTSATGGTYTYAGGGGGFTFTGKGIYTITKGANDTLSMRQGDAGCVNGVPGGCTGHVNTVTLTPTDSCR